MPIAKLKGGDGALSVEDVLNADPSGDIAPYTGPIPIGKNMFRFRLERLKLTETKDGADMLKVLGILDGSERPEAAEYDGCPMWDNISFVPGAARKMRSFVDCLGVDVEDVFENMVIDDDGVVLSIGDLAIDGEELEFYCIVVGKPAEKDKSGNVVQAAKLDATFTGYQPYIEEDGATEPEPEPDPEPEPPKAATRGRGRPPKAAPAPAPAEPDPPAAGRGRGRPAKSAPAPAPAAARGRNARASRAGEEPPF